jgi:hypothetical protein
MRRLPLLFLCIIGLALPQAAAADDYVGAPETHGPDSTAINQGPTEAPPAGGPVGQLVPTGKYLSGVNVRTLLPTEWCGAERWTDDTTDELGNGSYKYHAVYMIPADGRDRFHSYAGAMQRDAFEASGLLERLYGRAIRLDMGTSCGPQYLDITVVRMTQTTSQLNAETGTETGVFDSIDNALDNAGLPTIEGYDTYDQAAQLTKNYVVWYDGPAPGGTCGQGTIYDDPSRADDNLNNLGGKVAAVYRDPNGGFCDSNTVRHEIGHTLGALQRVAPHAFDGMHCNDAAADTMCYPNVPPQRPGGPFFDYHNDDYWDPPGGNPLPWWTVDLNRFLCPNATCNVVPGAVNQNTQVEAAGNPSECARAVRRHHPRRAHVRGCSRSHVALRVAGHHGRGWHVVVRAGGQGQAIVALRCRRHRGGQVDTVAVRITRLPSRLRMNVRCVTRPRPLAFVRSSSG